MEKRSDDTYVFSRVSNNARVSFIDLTLVRMGMTAILSQFMLGATIETLRAYVQSQSTPD